MARRRAAPLILVGLVLSLASCMLASSGAGAQEAEAQAEAQAAQAHRDTHPNLVFVLADDATWEDMMQQPDIRALANHGALFDDFHITNPLCCPSRATFMTGLYPHNTTVELDNKGGVRGWQQFVRAGNLRDWLPGRLKDAGYETALCGKLMNGYTNKMKDPPGLDMTYITPENRPDLDNQATSRCAEWMRSHAHDHKPLAVFLWLRSPHCPCKQPLKHHEFKNAKRKLPASYMERNVSEKLPQFSKLRILGKHALDGTWRSMLSMTWRVDSGLVQMQRTTRDLGISNDTVFAVSSDNGFFLGEHRDAAEKGLPYSPATHVPMIFDGPGVPTGTSHQLAGNHDFVPTVLALLGLPPREDADGRDLFGSDLSQRGGIEIENPSPAVHTLSKKGAKLTYGLPGYRAIRTDSGGLYVEWDNGHTEYYTDPDQIRPARPPDYMHRWLATLASCQGAKAGSCQAAENAHP
jgi:arylsulfatase A-like enzyme